MVPPFQCRKEHQGSAGLVLCGVGVEAAKQRGMYWLHPDSGSTVGADGLSQGRESIHGAACTGLSGFRPYWKMTEEDFSAPTKPAEVRLRFQ